MVNGHRLHMAASLADAVAALAERAGEGAPLAGATWIMRAPLRREPAASAYVGIARIPELRRIDIDDRSVAIGACVSHAQLAAALAPHAECRALAQAAGHSANPAIRRMATVGGNLSTSAFAAADLVPALLCLDAEVELQIGGTGERMALQRFLAHRTSLEPGWLLNRVIVPRRPRRSAHVRLPLRRAGDYPVAIVSLAVEDEGAVSVAIGSVEPVARRWPALEAALKGDALDPVRAAARAADHLDGFNGRAGIEAPGWYRVEVLPVLVGRAVAALGRPA